MADVYNIKKDGGRRMIILEKRAQDGVCVASGIMYLVRVEYKFKKEGWRM